MSQTKFKDGKTLLEEMREKGRIRKVNEGRPPNRPNDPTYRPPDVERCNYCEDGLCGPSREAVRLGLAKLAQKCSGRLEMPCTIKNRLDAGETVEELYQPPKEKVTVKC